MAHAHRLNQRLTLALLLLLCSSRVGSAEHRRSHARLIHQASRHGHGDGGALLPSSPIQGSGTAESEHAEFFPSKLFQRVVPVVGKDDHKSVFGQAFVIVGVAEVFDKTWFVCLLYSLQHGASLAFCASFSALACHVALAAALGAFISRLFAVWVLHLITAAVFGLFACFYAYEYWTADPGEDALRSRTEEAQRDIGGADSEAKGVYRLYDKNILSRFGQVFLAIFVAEFGDRTQVAMITLHSSLPLVPVCLGSLAAFFVLSASAALIAKLLEGRHLSERTICGFSAVSFALFAALSFANGISARSSGGGSWHAM